jgi:retinol dehydrogenase 12
MVTGPSSGIGAAMVISLARSGFHVVAAGRSEQRISPVVDRVLDHGGSAEYLHLDLASLESARDASRAFTASGRDLSLLVNNAGIGVNRRGLTDDGFEVHFGINHLGHFMLTHQLRPALRPGSRVVQIASSVHFAARGIDFDRVRQRTSLTGYREYAASKLANVLFVSELARRQPGWRIYATHPGLVDTPLIPRWSRPFIRARLLTPEEGADTPLWCATSPDVDGDSGLYYALRQAVPPSPAAQDRDLALELWERSSRWCGIEPWGG